MSDAQSARCRIAVLISGSGSNLQAFIDAQSRGDLDADIVHVLSNVATAFGLVRAQRAGIPTTCIEHGQFASREDFDRAIADAMQPSAPDLVVLAGFMRILSPWFVQQFKGRIINIHPALLPKYPGLDTHARAIEAGDSHHGSTVHFVTEELDGGPGILAARLPIRPDDTPASLQERVQSAEHIIYPRAANWFATGRLEFKDALAQLDKRQLVEPQVQDFD